MSIRRACVFALLTGVGLVGALRSQDAPQKASQKGPAGEPSLNLQVRRSLDQARPALRHHLKTAADDYLVLATLAALHDGFAQDDPDFAAAVDKVAQMNLMGTYALSLRLTILSEAPWFPRRAALAKRDFKQLQHNFVGDGFTYSGLNRIRADLSNTQYGALGMRAAVALGFKVPDRMWRDLARGVMDKQTKDGGFVYTQQPGIEFAYASMTAAGIVVLEMCRQAFGDESRGAKALTKPVERGWRWLDGNSRSVGNLNERSSFYFHYALERAGILAGVAEVGDASWYEAGAEMFVASQLDSGGWRAPAGVGALAELAAGGKRGGVDFGTVSDTSFAVLFLRRKFQRDAGPITTSGAGAGILALQPDASTEDIKAAAKLAVAQGSAGMAAVVEAMGSEQRSHRIAAGYALIGLCAEDFGFNPHRGAEHNQDPIAKAKAWLKANPYR